MMRLSKNFTLHEMTKSNTALRLGIENDPSKDVVRNLQIIVMKILQPLRNRLGPIRINSGYRSVELNKAIGGSSRSQHCKGQAVDLNIIIDGKSDNKLIFDTVLEMDLDFDQMINEFDYSWIHISYNKDNNRKQLLEAYKNVNGKTKYKNSITKKI
jgi:D-alanyl-D-alanine dipeptidase